MWTRCITSRLFIGGLKARSKSRCLTTIGLYLVTITYTISATDFPSSPSFLKCHVCINCRLCSFQLPCQVSITPVHLKHSLHLDRPVLPNLSFHLTLITLGTSITLFTLVPFFTYIMLFVAILLCSNCKATIYSIMTGVRLLSVTWGDRSSGQFAKASILPKSTRDLLHC